MKNIAFTSLLFISTPTMAEGIDLNFGLGKAVTKIRANSAAGAYDRSVQLSSEMLGLSWSPEEQLSLEAELSKSRSQGVNQIAMQSLRLFPSYRISSYGIWSVCGLGFHEVRELGTKYSNATALAGVAFRPETGVEGLRLDFEILYEASWKADSFEADGQILTRYRSEATRSSIGLSYRL